ncbi:phospholipase-like protein [Tanacetum coccineum]
MSQLYLLALSTNSILVKDMMVKLFEIDNERDLRTVADTYAMCQQLHERLPVILEGAKVFDKKGIHPSDYTISFKLADNVPKQGGIYGDCGVWVCIFLYRLAHGLSLDVEDPVDVALAYREKMVQLI